MTLCFAAWNRRRRRLRVANAGQEAAVALSRRQVRTNLLWDFRWECSKSRRTTSAVTFSNAGDIVVFHSDGIADTQNSSAEFFGHNRWPN